MTTGEAFCFGSNANGQFKQINYQYFSQPTPLKLGSECCIVDLGAIKDTISVCVMGTPSGANHTAFHFSKYHSLAMDSPTTQLEVSGYPVSIQPVRDGDVVVVGCLEGNSASEATADLFKATQACKTAVTLLGLLDRILEQNKAHGGHQEEVGLNLLHYFKQALLRWSMVLSSLVQDLRQSMLQGQASQKANNLGTVYKRNGGAAKFEQDEVMSALIKLHFCFVDVVGYGSFYDLDIGPDLESYIERLSLDYEAESSKIYRRLKNLFQLPFKNFSQIRHLVGISQAVSLRRGFTVAHLEALNLSYKMVAEWWQKIIK
uniref:Uncharacterized protein n=1 Tax=Ditylenchus dipsaci TaxID=166011 RepID=A0A915CVE7_9BILA